MTEQLLQEAVAQRRTDRLIALTAALLASQTVSSDRQIDQAIVFAQQALKRIENEVRIEQESK